MTGVPELPQVPSGSHDNLITLEDWLASAKEQIDSLDAELIAVNVFAHKNTDRSWIVAHPQYKLTEECQRSGDEMVKQRAAGVPLAYLLRYREFYGRKFQVCPGVLIPRPETETLIDLVKELDLPPRVRFLEIGTGCGCIGITLALEFPQSEVLATDLSSDALMIAEHNNLMHEGRISLLKSDLFEAISPRIHGKFDVIIANMPYVDPNWQWVDTHSLRHEPLEALYALGENGLSVYRRFFEELGPQIEKLGPKFCVVEADPCQHKDLIKIALQNGWKLIKSQDYGLCFRKKRVYKKAEQSTTKKPVAKKSAVKKRH